MAGIMALVLMAVVVGAGLAFIVIEQTEEKAADLEGNSFGTVKENL